MEKWENIYPEVYDGSFNNYAYEYEFILNFIQIYLNHVVPNFNF